MKKLNNVWLFIRRQPRWRLGVAAGIIMIAAIGWLLSGPKSSAKAPTFTARRGALDITVLEGGSLQALESQEIKCEVRVGYQGTKILKIVEEGYFVTEDDVKTNKVLCELDSSDLQKQIVQQEIQFQSAAASLTDAQQNYEIQLGQNDSDIKAAEQKARFARMDFDKFLGDSVAANIIEEAGLNKFLAQVNADNSADSAATNSPAPVADKVVPPAPPLAAATPAPTNTSTVIPAVQIVKADAPVQKTNGLKVAAATDADADDNSKPPVEMPNIQIDFSKYGNIDILGDGEAKQKLRKLDDDLQVAQKELGQAKTALEGTQRLFDKGYVPKTEITKDQITYESAILKVQSAETSRALFLKYELSRTAEETLSKYGESVRELDKARRVAISKLAQAKAKLNSAKGQYDVQLHQRTDLQDQLDKCTLTAKKSGLVVYGGNADVFYGNQDPIREGATVRERQSIITIPDLTKMSVSVKIHESYIKKIKKGQKARITVDAFPDQELTGEVTKVSVLPDSQNRWMSPDLKVYVTTIAIDGTHDWVKPGMSAKVEIFVNHLSDVVYVPVQAVAPDDGHQFCYVMNGLSPQRRQVEIGEFTDEFIEIKKGLAEGDRVLLRPPDNLESGSAPKQSKPAKPEKPAAPSQPAPSSAPATAKAT